MRKWLRRFGTGLWVSLALVGVTVVAMTALGRLEAQDPARQEFLMKFAEFQPLQVRQAVLVVDVRDEESFGRGHIPGALHVPTRDVDERVADLRLVAGGRPVVTYCSCPAEATSLKVARMLTEAGVPAKALVGGFPRWIEFGGAVERRE